MKHAPTHAVLVLRRELEILLEVAADLDADPKLDPRERGQLKAANRREVAQIRSGIVCLEHVTETLKARAA